MGMPYSNVPTEVALKSINDVSHTPFWLDDPSRPQPQPALTKEVSTQLLIIGGGFTGLWTALLAKEENPGRDVTLAAYGPMVRTCLEAAEVAARERIELEVLDLRSVSPLDVGTITASVRRTGRLVVVHEAPVFFGAGAEIAARLTEHCFHHLEAPVLRVGGFHTPYPPARLEHGYLPDADRVLDAAERSLAY